MPACFKCQRPFAPQSPIASYENRTYHPECLTCKKCNKSVSGQKFLKDKNQDIICENCDALYGPVCNKCRKSFKPGQSYKKLDENLFYHYECFLCYGPCRKPIEGEFYDLDNGQFICTDCFDKHGARDSYDDLLPSQNKFNKPAPIVESVMGTKPSSNTDKRANRYQDDDVNTLTSNFTVKLNTSPNPPRNTNYADQPSNVPTANRNENNRRFDNPPPPPADTNPNRRSRFDNSNNDSGNAAKPAKSNAVVCEKCKQPIQGTYSVYNDRNYHAKCFTCSRCNKEFKGKQFFKIDDAPVCAECHQENLNTTASKCRKCQKPILDTVLTFMNDEYHEYCLVCNMCSRKLIGASIYTDKQMRPYCIDCFTKKEAKLCAKCLKPISPNQSNIVFEDKPFHKECFTCESCRRPIKADESFFKNDNDDIICVDCSSYPTGNSSF